MYISSIRCVTQIIIQQVNGPAERSKRLEFDFVNEFSATDSWTNLTDKATVVLPKNVYVRDETGKLFAIGGTNKNIGGFDGNTPLFLRGDKISINYGYRYYDKLGNDKLDMPSTPVFSGYISAVKSRMPIELECEDNMWKLKQLRAPNKVFPASTYTYEKILTELISGTGFTVNALTSTTLGDFRTQNETVAQVIERVRKAFHLEAYFRGDELRCGSKVYIDSEAVTNRFEFQKNIIEDNLEYKRKDDVNLSVVVYSVNKEEADPTKRGTTRTKQVRLEILIYQENGEFKYLTKQKGVEYPKNVDGERRTLYFWNVKSAEELFNKGVEELKKYYYTGLTGDILTFAIPITKMGDNIDLIDNYLPERNGRYKVKAVEYTGGVNGHRQKITVDFLIFPLDPNGKPRLGNIITGNQGG